MEVCLGPLELVPDDGMKQFEVEGTCILICRVGDTIHAVNGVCPHRGAQLGQGHLEGAMVVCPWHDWAFDVESGCGLTNPVSSLVKYEVALRNDQIVVMLPDS